MRRRHARARPRSRWRSSSSPFSSRRCGASSTSATRRSTAQVVREMRAGSFVPAHAERHAVHAQAAAAFLDRGALTYVFGVYSIWPFVLPSLIAFALLLWLMHRCGGPMAAFVCGTSLLMWGSAQTARMDVAVRGAARAGGVSASIARTARCRLRPGVATGVAFLVKGPMAPVIMLALFVFEVDPPHDASRAANDALGAAADAASSRCSGSCRRSSSAARRSGGRSSTSRPSAARSDAWVHKSPPWFYLVRAPLTLAAVVLPRRRGARRRVQAERRAREVRDELDARGARAVHAALVEARRLHDHHAAGGGAADRAIRRDGDDVVGTARESWSCWRCSR